MDDEDVLFDRTADTVEIASNDGDKRRLPFSKIYVTILLFLAFFALGLFLSIPGPTLVDLCEITQTNISEISWLFTARSIGYLCGSLFGGILFDCVNGLVLIGVTLILAGLSTSIIPWSKTLLHLTSLIIFQGLSMGILDTGGNVLCLNIWHENSGSAMQLLHFSFGFGAFIAPLIAEPFLAQHHESTLFKNSNNSDVLAINEDNDVILFAYMFIGIFGIIIGIGFICFFVYSLLYKHEMVQSHAQRRLNTENGNFCFRIQILILLALFFFFYVGSEVAYASFISKVSMLLYHDWSRGKAAFLVSVYWGSFAIGRFITIFLTRVISIRNILIMDLFISTCSLIALSIFADNSEKVLWIMSGTLGFGFAAIFPAGISWVEKHIQITGKAASIFVVGSALGEMIIPVVAGHLIYSPMALFYMLLVICSLCVLIFLLMMLLAYRQASGSFSTSLLDDQVPLTTNFSEDETNPDIENPNNDKRRHVTFNLSNAHVPNKNGVVKNSILKVKDYSKKD